MNSLEDIALRAYVATAQIDARIFICYLLIQSFMFYCSGRYRVDSYCEY